MLSFVGNIVLLTIAQLPLEIHTRGKHALRANRPLNLRLILWWSMLHDFGLINEAGVATLSRCREACGNLALRTQKLNEYSVHVEQG